MSKIKVSLKDFTAVFPRGKYAVHVKKGRKDTIVSIHRKKLRADAAVVKAKRSCKKCRVYIETGI